MHMCVQHSESDITSQEIGPAVVWEKDGMRLLVKCATVCLAVFWEMVRTTACPGHRCASSILPVNHVAATSVGLVHMPGIRPLALLQQQHGHNRAGVRISTCRVLSAVAISQLLSLNSGSSKGLCSPVKCCLHVSMLLESHMVRCHV